MCSSGTAWPDVAASAARRKTGLTSQVLQTSDPGAIGIAFSCPQAVVSKNAIRWGAHVKASTRLKPHSSIMPSTAARLGPDRPEGHYWLAADMGALAESFGMSQGVKYRSRIKAELERVAAIDAAWEQASAVTALGRWYYLVPRLFGGSRSKADEHFRRALDQFPHSVTALLFLAESLTAQKKTDDARTLLQRIADAPIEEKWAPEVREYKRKAADRLQALASAGREQ